MSSPPSPKLQSFAEFRGDLEGYIEHVEQYRQYTQIKAQMKHIKKKLFSQDLSITLGSSPDSQYIPALSISQQDHLTNLNQLSSDSPVLSCPPLELKNGLELGQETNKSLEDIEISFIPLGDSITPNIASTPGNSMTVSPIHLQPGDFGERQECQPHVEQEEEQERKSLLQKEKKQEVEKKKSTFQIEPNKTVLQKEAQGYENEKEVWQIIAHGVYPPLSNSFVCKYCHKICKSNTHLVDHLRCSHKNPGSCRICGKVFPSSKKLREHSKFVHSAVCLPCPKCGKAFKGRSNLVRHELTCTPRLPALNKQKFSKASCKICSKIFSSYSSHRRHMKNVHDQVLKKIDRTGTPEQKLARRQSCHLCAVEVITVHELHEHMKESHGGEKVWPCSKCDKTFVSNELLGDHKRRVHPSKTQQCKGRDGKVGCGKTFKRSDSLRDHLRKKCGKPLKKWEDLSYWGKANRSKN